MPEPLSPKSGFGIKVAVMPALARDVLDHVFVDHHVVGHPPQRREAHVDLALPTGRDLVVMGFDGYADLLERQHHAGADILQGIGRRDGK